MKLPPMNALRAFEAVARLGSVTRAADELCVSQGAVSQQIRNLEDHLGRELFDRSGNTLKLTDEGEAFAKVVLASLADIAEAANSVARNHEATQLMISTWQGFAYKWLMPHLGEFYAIHPETSVALDQSTRVVDFRNDGVDAAIRFGDGDFEGLNCVLLFHPSIRAVASPAYLAEHGPMRSLSEPGEHRLIDHLYPSVEIRKQHIHWDDCVDGDLRARGNLYLSFPDEQQAFNAALQGQGIALSSIHMVEQELEDGLLAFAAPGSIPARGAIWFVWPTDIRTKPALDALRDWLLDALAGYRDG